MRVFEIFGLIYENQCKPNVSMISKNLKTNYIIVLITICNAVNNNIGRTTNSLFLKLNFHNQSRISLLIIVWKKKCN